jgi:hypothetical protein
MGEIHNNWNNAYKPKPDTYKMLKTSEPRTQRKRKHPLSTTRRSVFIILQEIVDWREL